MGLETAPFIGDLVASNPVAGDPKSQGDDHLRLIKAAIQATFPNLGGRFNRVQAKTGSYTALVTDNQSVLRFTGTGPWTLSASTSASLGNGWAVLVLNDSDVALIFDPAGTEEANGSTTLNIPAGYAAWIINTAVAADEFMVVMAKRTPSEGIATSITGNVTLTSADAGTVKVVTATAVITLPAANTLTTGDKFGFKSLTTGDVTIVRASTDTIDGLTTYRLPAYTNCEVTKYATGAFALTIKPDHDVGDWLWAGYGTANQGWVKAGSGNRNRTTDAGLFAVYGTTWGAGDGSTTFGIPSGAGRALVQAGTGTVTEQITSQTAAANAIPVTSNTAKWFTGMLITVSASSGFGGTGLANGTHYVVRVTSTTLSFATTLANAQNGTVETLTGTGSALLTHTYSARTLGEYGGEQTHALSNTEALLHNHVQDAHAHTEQGGGTGSGSATIMSITSASASAVNNATGNSTASTTATNQSVGGNVAMNILNPFMVGELYIKL